MHKERKKEHKKIVHALRKINKQLSNDSYLGLNRFSIQLETEKWFKFDDGSGGILDCTYCLKDKLTGNSAVFYADNFEMHKINKHVNDFLIRCSSGHPGHYPPLYYVAYDVHEVIPYEGNPHIVVVDEDTICTYDWRKQ